MKINTKKVGIVLLIIFIVGLTLSVTVYAQSSISRGYYIGGRIKFLKAAQVSNLENTGYVCDVPGTSIEITPVRGQNETSFLITTTAKKWTKQYNLRQGQWILSKRQGSTTITCQKCEGEYDSEECVQESFDLPNIIEYATSR